MPVCVARNEEPVSLAAGDIMVGNWRSYQTLFTEGLIELL